MRMLSKSSFFTTILLLLPALASAQTADDDLQLELRYYAPKLKFTSHGIVPAAYSNFRDTLNIKNGNAPEYRLSGKNWYVDYIAIHEKRLCFAPHTGTRQPDSGGQPHQAESGLCFL